MGLQVQRAKIRYVMVFEVAFMGDLLHPNVIALIDCAIRILEREDFCVVDPKGQKSDTPPGIPPGRRRSRSRPAAIKPRGDTLAAGGGY